jgi:polyisoprenoid-binding protein YceI
MSRYELSSGTLVRTPARVSPTADLERWEIDPARSSLEFVLRHLVVSEIKGRFSRWGGTLFLARKQPLLSSVHVWVDVATIDTGDPERDAHILSSEFLDSARIARAEFDGSDIEEREGRAIVHGRLRLHGVSHDLDVEVDPYVLPVAGAVNVYRVRAKVDRQSFGLHWNQDLDVGGVVVGDEIRLSAELTLVRTNGDV